MTADGDVRAEVLALLEEWQVGAERAASKAPDERERRLAEQELELIPRVAAFAEIGDVWRAVYGALWLGETTGSRRSVLLERVAGTLGLGHAIGVLYMDADRGRKHPAGGRKGAGRRWGNFDNRRKKVRAAVEELHAAQPSRKPTDVCREVAGKFQLSVRQALRLTEDIRW